MVLEYDIILAAILNINNELYDSMDGYDYREEIYVEAMNNSYGERVEFMGIQLWSSEDDNRKYDEEKDDYEPLELYLRRELQKVISTMKTINVYSSDKDYYSRKIVEDVTST